jgi:hypothetical protein
MISLLSMVRFVAAIMLFIPLGRHPRDYQNVLRWLVLGVVGYMLVLAFNTGRNGWVWTCALIVLVFNPFFPVNLSGASWRIVDAGVAALLLLSILSLDTGR